VDKQLRRLCGWEYPGELPSEATFSRAFAEFSRSELPARLHEALIKRSHEDRLVGHISRDATAIEAREKPVKTAAPEASTRAQPPKRKRGRPKKGEVVEKKEPRRHSPPSGRTPVFAGYVAIPLATMTASRVINLYDLMDSAYDAPEIKAKSCALGHVPIIDRHPRNVPGGKQAIATEARGRRKAGYALAEDVRYNERSAAERVNGRLKDDFGGRYVRLRGHAKVLCHLMFGVLALSIEQLMRLLT
jgi:hypothetical protein